MDVHRRRGAQKRAVTRHVEQEQQEYVAFDENKEDKYHSRSPVQASGGAGGGESWAAYVGSYVSWLYDLLPSWSAFAWLLRYGPSEEPFEMMSDMQDRVDRFKTHIGVAWSEDEPEHLQLLERYWQFCFPNFGFLRRDKRWTDVGFQGPDPGTDFRGGKEAKGMAYHLCGADVILLAGVFGLKHLVYYASQFGTEFAGATRSGYPLSVAGLNVTMILYQLLGWGFKKTVVASATKRVLFEYLFADDRVLEEERFEKLYCRAMIMLDQEWKRQNATYMQFPMVLAKTQEQFVVSN